MESYSTPQKPMVLERHIPKLNVPGSIPVSISGYFIS